MSIWESTSYSERCFSDKHYFAHYSYPVVVESFFVVCTMLFVYFCSLSMLYCGRQLNTFFAGEMEGVFVNVVHVAMFPAFFDAWYVI